MSRWLSPLLVFVVTCVAFWSAADAQFVNLDDDQNFVHNPSFRGLGPDRLRWMFSTAHMGHFQPLSWSTFGLDYALWGLDAAKFHAASILWHALAALSVYVLALALFERVAADRDVVLRRSTAALAALLFAVHPLRAESVAWVTGRNDVVSGAFFALAVAAWLRATPTAADARDVDPARSGTPWRWPVALAAGGAVIFLASIDLSGRSAIALRGLRSIGLLLAFGFWAAAVLRVAQVRTAAGFGRGAWCVVAFCCVLLSLLGKAYAITAPVVLLVLDVWPLGRRRGGATLQTLALEKAPLFALTLCFGLIAFWAKAVPVASMKAIGEHSFVERIVQAFYGLGFYPAKTLLPSGLIPMYDLPASIRAQDPRFLVPILGVLAVTAVLIAVRRRWPAGLAAWVCYAVLVLPVSGLTQSGAQLVADRYSYVACLPFALLAAGSLLRAVPAQAPPSRALMRVALVGAPLVIVLGVLTWRQAARWQDSETIYAHGIEVGRSPRLLTNLALVYNQRAFEQPAERTEHLARALELSDEAIAVADERDLFALEMLLHRGTILYNLERFDEAETVLRQFVRAAPNDAQGLINLGLVLNRRAQYAQSVPVLQRAVTASPDSADAWRYLGLAFEGVGDPGSAVRSYERALELAPGQPMASERLGVLRAAGGE